MPRRPKRPRGRNIHGVLLFDKPQGLSSNQALQEVKSLYKAAKVGHTGSLDPMATGMLPLCFGEATKVSSFLLDADKTYEMRVKFGVKTDSGDADGKVTQEADASFLSAEKIAAELQNFLGDLEQIPPMYSALHHNGVRLYELARQGIEVEREPRPITIHSNQQLNFDSNEDGVFADIRVCCSKGTYVRTVAEDLAIALGTVAHLVGLRRTEVGNCGGDMITLEQLQAIAAEDEKALFPLLGTVEAVIEHWPAVEVDVETAAYLREGHAVQWPGLPREGYVRLREEALDRFMGVGEIDDDGRVSPKRLIRCA